MTKKTIKKVLSALLALSLLLASSVVTLAAPVDVPDPAIKGSITVHKYGTDHEPTTPADGLEITDNDTLSKLGTPMKNVGFTLYLIKETDDNDWKFKEGMTATEALQHVEREFDEEFTDASGEIYWSNLDSVRYYVLKETTPPTEGTYRPMDATIIAVPYGFTGSGTGWNYNVHVYPKNVNDEEITKTVDENKNGYKVGDTVTWTIDGKIPTSLRLPNEETGAHAYGALSFHDQLDTRLDFTPGTETVNMIVPGDIKVVLDRTTEYTVEDEAPHGVKIALTEAGIDKVVDAGAGRIEIILPTTINSTATVTSAEAGDIVIENNVTKKWEHAVTREEKEVEPSEKPKVDLAYIEIIKVDNKQKDILLNGAQFKIATSADNAKVGDFITNSKGEDIIVTTAAGGGKSAGYAVISGLPASEDKDVTYYLREVKAPEAPADHPDWKYVLRPDAISVTISAGSNHAEITVDNTRLGDDGPGPIFGLPLTGGIGSVIFIAAGLLLVLIGIFALKKSKRIEKK